MSADEHGGRPPDLTADECVRAGTYWFGQGDFTAAEAWWRCALQIESDHLHALECMKLLATARPGASPPPRPSASEPAVPDPFATLDPFASPVPSAGPDPFSGPDPFATPVPSENPDPFATLDPFASPVPSAGPDPFSGPDSFAAPSAAAARNAFAAPAQGDPFLPSAGLRGAAPLASGFGHGLPGPADDLAGDILPLAESAAPRTRTPSASLETGSAREMREVSAFLDEMAAESSQLPEVTDLSDLLGDEAPAPLAPTAGSPPLRTASPLPPLELDSSGPLRAAPARTGSTDPLEFATDIQEETGDVIRMDDASLTGNVSHTPWDDVPAIPDDDDDDDDLGAFASGSASFASDHGEGSDVIGVFDDGQETAPALSADPEIQLDEPVEMSSAPEPAPDSPESLLQEARDRFQLHDFVGAIELAQRLEAVSPGLAEARALIQQSQSHLMRMLESKVGSLDRVPKLLISNEEVIWLNLNHRAGFVLAQIDGSLSYDDVIMLSGMPRLDALRIIVELIQNRVIGAD